MIFFGLAMAIAVLLELSQSGIVEINRAGLMPVFWHFLLVGWITQIIMGVSVWMFPRKKRGEVGGGENYAWIAFIGINLGLIMRAIAEPASMVSVSNQWIQTGMIFSSVLQVVGGTAYVIGIWPRVRGKRKPRRR